MDRIIKVENLNVTYGDKQALRNVTFEIASGHLIGIIGPNGAGKSTLMKAMLNLIKKDQGKILIENQSIKKIQKKIAYVPQRATIDWDFPITVQHTVLLGTFPSLRFFQRPSKKHYDLAQECLEKVGMAHFAHKQIGELSGGQQQRVFLARALAQKAQYLFLDEPFVGIDVTSESFIISLLKELRDEGKSIFVVHHDLSKVKSYFDDLIIINGTLISAGPVEVNMNPEVLRQAFHAEYSLLEALEVGNK